MASSFLGWCLIFHFELVYLAHQALLSVLYTSYKTMFCGNFRFSFSWYPKMAISQKPIFFYWCSGLVTSDFFLRLLTCLWLYFWNTILFFSQLPYCFLGRLGIVTMTSHWSPVLSQVSAKFFVKLCFLSLSGHWPCQHSGLFQHSIQFSSDLCRFSDLVLSFWFIIYDMEWLLFSKPCVFTVL